MIKSHFIVTIISVFLFFTTYKICEYVYSDKKDKKDSKDKVFVEMDYSYRVYDNSLDIRLNVFYWYDGNIVSDEYYRDISNIDSLKKECDKRADNYTKLIKNEPTK